MNDSDKQHSDCCPNCESSDSAIPVVAVDGTTLWRCNLESCSGETWTTQSVPEGLRENPAVEDVQNYLLGAAEYREDDDLREVANDITALYDGHEGAHSGRELETPPTC